MNDIKTYAELIAPKLRPEWADSFMDDSGRADATASDFHAKLAALRASGRFTMEGLRGEVRAAARAAQNEIAEIRGKADRLRARAGEARRVVLASAESPRATDPTAALLREMRLAEYRRELRTIDPLLLSVQLHQAATAGSDPDMLDAVFGAPKAFPLLPAEELAKVQATRQDAVVSGVPEIADLEMLERAYRYVAASGERDIESGLRGHGLSVEDCR
jgi:hypothetical protein